MGEESGLGGIRTKQDADTNREQGQPAPTTYFLALGREVWDEGDQEAALLEYLASGMRPHRALFITDNVGGGTTIRQTQEFLDALGIENDVASAQAETDLLHDVSLHHLDRQAETQFYGVDSRPRHSETQLLHATPNNRTR